MTNKINSKTVKMSVNSELDLLLDDFEGQFDLIDFDKETYIPIEYDVDKFLNQFIFKNPPIEDIIISLNENSDVNILKTNLFRKEFIKQVDNICKDCEESLDGTGLVNTYISLGSIKYDDNLAPCLFIPVFLKKEQDTYKISRNYNQEIQENILLKIILKEDHGINLPSFDGDIKKLINQLIDVDGIEYQKSAFVSNFDLRFNHIFLDLNCGTWNNFEEKFSVYHDNEDICSFHEFNKFKDKLTTITKNFRITDDYLFLKSLLSQDNSILVIGNKQVRNNVKNCFSLIDSESLILELSNDLSKEEFQDIILDNNVVQSSNELVNLDSLVRKHNELENIVALIKGNYTFLSPKQIKKNKDYYLNRIKSQNIENFNFELEDTCYYDEETCKKMEKQIKYLFSKKDDIFIWHNYFSVNDLNSNFFNTFVNLSNNVEYHLNHFIEFNDYLNKKYSIKIFDNLHSVDILNNLKVLDKSYKYLNDENINNLNNFIKDSDQNYESLSEIENNVKYTEIINKEIIDETKTDLIKNDFKNVIDCSDYLIDYSNFLLKEFNEISEFYKKFNFFEIDTDLLNLNNSFDDLKILIKYFKKHVGELLNFKEFLTSNVLNMDVENFTEFIFENDFKENEISIIFWFNFYNSLLNNFLNDNDKIDETKILSEYELDLDAIKKRLNKHNQELLIRKIYSKPIELNNSQKVLNQKNELIQDFPDDVKSIKDLLEKYKEFITANKRILLMDIASVSQFLSNAYENYFDFVIITDDLKYNLDKMSLLLRSKNKILFIKGDIYE